MTPTEMIEYCDQQLAMVGNKASVTLIMPEKWKKSNTKKLCGKNSPTGKIISDRPTGVLVMFRAIEVKQFLESKELNYEQNNRVEH